MTKIKNPNRGFFLVEVLLVLAILGIIAGLYVRIFYGVQLIRWEDGIYTSMGIKPEMARFVIGVTFIFVILVNAVKQRRKRKR